MQPPERNPVDGGMGMRLSDLWRWDGVIDRGPYALWGLILAAVKYNFDRFVIAGGDLPLLAYWFPGSVFGALSSEGSRAEILQLALASLPFVYVGVVLTLRRLRAAGLPVWLVVLFFAPFLNLLLFLVLCVAPSRPELTAWGADSRWLDRLVPQSMEGAAAMSVALTVIPGTLLVWLGTVTLQNYGWGLFLGIPFLLGFIATVVYSHHGPRSLGACVTVSLGALVILAGLLAVLAVEGIICIFMASPIAAIGTALGALVAWAVPPFRRRAGRMYGSLLGLMPLALAIEAGSAPAPTLIEVRTAVEIDAPPERVWAHVISFEELPPPREWFFRAGIAYPTRAVIHGEGVGAVRRCEFSTGAFVEPITRWDAPRTLEFDVTEQPRAMRELMVWPGAEPPHVDGYLVSRRGRFRLEPLDGGRRTRLEGTTWYTHRLWPEPYWRLWSDWLIGRIHRRVLDHIGTCAERN